MHRTTPPAPDEVWLQVLLMEENWSMRPSNYNSHWAPGLLIQIKKMYSATLRKNLSQEVIYRSASCISEIMLMTYQKALRFPKSQQIYTELSPY
ncbi:hypothetical protein UY3_01470 [Chelonia mydas]|uniref:Uncharacterized protein n=1 Tax=Chelonia mydas TaxID=8469 RepID=M7BZD9_CHEMY|nr:hypothetical protein UY3_01470 [Chelonia mydas]